MTDIGGTTKNRQISVAVVGFGNAGRQHVAAINSVSGARLAAIVENDPAALSNAYDGDLPLRPLSAVLDDRSIELIALCIPPGYRPPITTVAVEAGKHLLVEKLPARSAWELSQLVGTVKQAGLLAGVMFQHRFILPEPLRDAAPERFAGAVANVLISRPRFDSHYREGWRAEPEVAGGGVTAHIGVHYIDLACQLLGEPAKVTPLTRVDAVPGIDVQMYGHVSFRSGAELTITVTSRAAARHDQLVVLGRRDWVEVRAGAVTGELDGQPIDCPARPASELRVQVYQELVDALLGGPAPNLAALSRSEGVSTVLDALLESPATNGSVR